MVFVLMFNLVFGQKVFVFLFERSFLVMLLLILNVPNHIV